MLPLLHFNVLGEISRRDFLPMVWKVYVEFAGGITETLVRLSVFTGGLVQGWRRLQQARPGLRWWSRWRPGWSSHRSALSWEPGGGLSPSSGLYWWPAGWRPSRRRSGRRWSCWSYSKQSPGSNICRLKTYSTDIVSNKSELKCE